MKRAEREALVARMRAAKGAAWESVGKLPHVRGLGTALRWVGGEVTGEIVWRVYVDVKVPRSELAPGAAVPETLEGFPTDVMEVPLLFPSCRTIEHWCHSPLKGGIKIETHRDLEASDGTLGCLVDTDDGKVAALSCDHVLDQPHLVLSAVFQPTRKLCLGMTCNQVGVPDSVRRVLGHYDAGGVLVPDPDPMTSGGYLDAAVFKLDSYIHHRARLRGITVTDATPTQVSLPIGTEGSIWVDDNGKIVDIKDEFDDPIDRSWINGSAAAVPGTIVWKVGITTGVTAGLVDDIDGVGYLSRDSGGALADPVYGIITILSKAGFTDPDSGLIAFDKKGDSGSAVMDLAGNVVGILFVGNDRPVSSVLTRVTGACHIGPVMTKLGITRIRESDESGCGPNSAVIESERTEDKGEDPAAALMAGFEQRLRSTPGGRQLEKLLNKHANECLELVNTRRAVTVVWHRKHGPAFVAAVARALRAGRLEVPAPIQGISFPVMLAAMADILTRNGSIVLRRDIEANREWILDVISEGRSIEEMLSLLEGKGEEHELGSPRAGAPSS
jgi:hypothetical protein